MNYLEKIVEAKPKVALQLAEELLKENNDPLTQTRVLNARAFAYYMLNDFNKTVETARAAEAIALKNNFQEQYAYALYHQGSAFWRTGDYAQAYELCTQALRIFEKSDNLQGQLYSTNRISTILFELNNFNKAQEFNDRCLQLAQKLNDNSLYARMLSNRSYMHYRQKDYQNMLKYALLSISVYDKDQENLFVRHPLVNAGVAYLELGDYKQAEFYLKKSIPISQQAKDKLTELIGWKFLARCHKNLKEFSLALPEAFKALNIAKEIKSNFEIKNIYLELAEIHNAVNNHKQAYTYLAEAFRLLEDLQSNEINDKIARTLKQYEIEKRENEIKLLHQEKTITALNLSRQQNIKNFLLLIALILFAATFITFRAFLARKKAHQVISLKNTELQTIDKIVKDINKETELNNLINSIFSHTLNLLPQTQRGGFLAYDEEDDCFRPVVFYGYSEQEVAHVRFSKEEAARRYKEKAELVAEGIYILRKPELAYGSERLREFMSLPEVILTLELALEGQTLGYLLFENFDNPAAFNNSDVERLIRVREHLISALVKTRYIMKLEEASRTDPLTCLLNRRGMIEKLQQEIDRYHRYKNPFAIAIGDLDDFKKINDTYGHECGDYALLEVAEIFRDKLRKVDQVGRWGGEEFLVLLPQTHESSALIAINKIREEIRKNPLSYKENTIKLSMTFGLAEFKDQKSLDECLSQADNALYYGKTLGKNRVITFSDLKRKQI